MMRIFRIFADNNLSFPDDRVSTENNGRALCCQSMATGWATRHVESLQYLIRSKNHQSQRSVMP